MAGAGWSEPDADGWQQWRSWQQWRKLCRSDGSKFHRRYARLTAAGRKVWLKVPGKPGREFKTVEEAKRACVDE